MRVNFNEMANIQQKHVRGSSTVKGPIKATETFGLIKASRTCGDFSLVRPGESAVRKPQRRSPESRTSPECIVSPGLKGIFISDALLSSFRCDKMCILFTLFLLAAELRFFIISFENEVFRLELVVTKHCASNDESIFSV